MLRYRTVLTLSLAVVTAAPLAAQERLAIKGGKILPVSGPPIEGGVVLIRGGKIEAVGKDVAIPSEAKVIDAAGKVVVPGFIETHSTRGMDQINESNPNVPFLSVVDAIDPSQDYFEECRRNGVTTVAVVPGNNTMFGGQAAVIKTAGMYVNEMVVKRGVGIKISLRPPNDRNRMGHLAALRRELDGARDSLASAKPAAASTGGAAATPGDSGDGERAAQQQPGRGRGGRGAAAPQAPADADTALVREALAKLLKGDVLAFIYCELAMDVPQAIKLVDDYKLKAVLVLGQDCYKAARQIAASKLPVVLDPTLVFWETDPRTGEDRQVILPRVYREAGVPVTFQVTGGAAGSLFRAANLPPTVGTNYLWYQAATAVKYGTPAAEALEAITLRPAKALGVDKLAGSIEPGKDADLAILTGDPLKLDTWVDTTIVAGKVVYERDQDRKLKQLLAPSAK
jgi:imidazolonepropionase-like amidohydrolase